MKKLREKTELSIKPIALLAVVVVAAIGLTIGWYGFSSGSFAGNDSGEYVGFVEARETTASFKVAGKVLLLNVDEGDRVKKGEVIASLETRELLSKVKQAAGALKQAQSKLSEAKVGKSLQAGVSQAQVEQATANLDITKATFDRTQQLFAAGGISQQSRDEASAAYQAALGKYSEAVAGMQQVALRAVDAQTAGGAITQAQGAYDEATAYLDNCVLKSPCDGIVTLRTIEPGEMVAAGTPVYQIADLAHTYVTVNVGEGRIGKINLGDTAKLVLDSFPGKTFKGKIIWISDAGDFAVKKAVSEVDRHDTRTFKVKIDLPNPDFKFKDGMTATATFGK